MILTTHRTRNNFPHLREILVFYNIDFFYFLVRSIWPNLSLVVNACSESVTPTSPKPAENHIASYLFEELRGGPSIVDLSSCTSAKEVCYGCQPDEQRYHIHYHDC